MGPTVLDTIERSLAVADGALTGALAGLSALAGPAGTSLVLDHRRDGRATVSDASWQGSAAHVRPVVSFGRTAGFDRIEIRVGEAARAGRATPWHDCAIVSAALDVVASVGDLAARYRLEDVPCGAAQRRW